MSRSTQLIYNIVCFSTKFLLYELFKLITEKNRSKFTAKNFVLKHTILYVHCIHLLMWSPTKLDFPFYYFSVIYYVFQRFR
jgi:hypothetical protein